MLRSSIGIARSRCWRYYAWRRARIRLLGLSLIAILRRRCNSWRTFELWRCDRFLREVHWRGVTSEWIRKNIWVRLLREWFYAAASLFTLICIFVSFDYACGGGGDWSARDAIFAQNEQWRGWAWILVLWLICDWFDSLLCFLRLEFVVLSFSLRLRSCFM